MPDPSHLTERQAKWFQSVREGLERDTGRTLDQWADLARTCPETAHRARLAWMKATYGLGQNHASMVLNAAFPPTASWSKPDQLAGNLWSDPHTAQIFAVIRDYIESMPDVVIGQRKSFTAFSRNVQFAAARPLRSGGVLLGLALTPDDSALLGVPGRESWSERLKGVTTVTRTEHLQPELTELLHQAWTRS